MAWNKFFSYLRQPAITGVVVIAVALVAVTAIPSVRSRVVSSLDSSANLFLFDEDPSGEASEDSSGEASEDSSAKARDGEQTEGKKRNGFKRVVTAPLRLFARLFKRKNNGETAMRKASEKDIEKMRMIPVNRSRDGVSDTIADANNGLAPEATTAEAAAKNLFDEAIELHGRGRLDGSIEKLVASTVLQPNFAEAFNLLGVCYDEKGQYRQAQEEYKKALKIESNNARFLNNLGYSCYLSNDFGHAVKYYNKGLRITPNDRRMHNNIGLAYGRKGDYDKAKRHFVIAVGETGANLNLGYVYSQQGKYEDAIKFYEAALRSQPQSLPALSNLAGLYERTGRLREAGMLHEQYKKLAVAAQQKDQTVDQDQ
ncbi:MAG: tetratricopeptide repeat protein [Blastocatellales bacterium]